MKQKEKTDSSFVKKLEQGCAILAAGLGLAALIGWVAGATSLSSFAPDWIPMAPSTAILFVLYGIGVLILLRSPESITTGKIGIAITAIGLLVALLLLILSMSGSNPNFEHLGMEISGTVGNAPIGHMSPLTALCFLLVGISFLAALPFASNHSWRNAATLMCALAATLIAFMLLVAYFYGSPFLYSGDVIPPALSTSFAFLFLGSSLLLFSMTKHWRENRRPQAEMERSTLALILVFLAMTVGIVTAGFLYYRSQERHYRTEVEEELQSITKLKINELTWWRKERLGDASVFFRNDNFSGLVQRYLNHPQDIDASQRLSRWLEQVRSAYNYDRVFILDDQGVERLSAPDTTTHKAAHPIDETVEILGSGEARFIDFHRDWPEGPVYLAVAVPILDEGNADQPLGMLVFRIDPETYLYPFLQQWPTLTKTAETLLVRRDENDVLFLNNLKFQENAALSLRIPLSNKNLPAAMAILGQEGVVQGKDYRNVPVLAAIGHIPDSPWHLVARMDTTEVYAPLREKLHWVVLFIGVLLLAAFAGVGLIWRQRQVLHLRERAEAAEALHESEERNRMTLKSIGDAVITTDAAGRVEMLNPVAEKLTGWSIEEARGKPLDEIFYIVNEETGEPVENPASRVIREGKVIGLANHTVLISRDGSQCPIADSGAPIRSANGDIIGVVMVFRDQSEERKRLHDQETRLKLMRLLNERNDTREMIRNVTQFLQERSGCEAVGVRLRKGDDYQYYETRGFPQKFVKAENSLCSYDLDGQLRRDEVGNPIHDCMCGNVLNGRFDPAQPFFTERGSFFSNWTTKLLATTTEEDRQARTRNRCNGDGYESVALVRLRTEEETLGLLQFNDHQKDRFTPEMMMFLENAADQIAIALAKRLTMERYHATLEDMLEGCQILDFDWCYTFVNEAAARHGRKAKEELLGKTFMEAYPGIEETKLFSAMRRCMEEREPNMIENQFVYPDGDTACFELSIQPVPEGIFILSIDVTGRRRAEENLRKNEAQLANAAEMAHLGPWEYDVINDLFTFNDHFYKIFRTTADKVGGYTMSSAEYARRFVHPDDAALVGEEVRKAIEATDSNFSRQLEHRILYADGSIGYVSVRFFIVKDNQGRTVRTFGVNQDITEQKQAEEDLRMFRTLIDNSNDAFEVVDMETGRFLDVNEKGCKDHGYSREEYLSLKIPDIDPTVDPSIFSKVRQELPKTGFMMHEGRHRRKDGTEFPVEVNIKFVHLDRDYMVTVVRDITDRKKAEEERGKLEQQFQQAQKMESIGRLAGGVAHDFNNLLTAISGFSDLAYDSLDESDPVRNDIGEIQKAADSAAALTAQLLAFSRKQIISPKVMDLNQAVAQSEKMLRRIIGEDIDFVFMAGEEISRVLIDPGQINQILVNLAVNSRDAMPDGGKLTIETRNVVLDEKRCLSCNDPIVGEYVMLAVSDNGPGMDAATIEKIFEPFFTTKEKGKGTGLGLATVHGVVHQSKGHINVYSEPGGGTTFKIYLPAVADEVGPDVQPVTPTAIRGHETILLVEDQEIVRKLAVRTLRAQGYTIIEAQNGGEAFLTGKDFKGKIDLLLTDVVMPQMSGKELHKHLAEIIPDMKVLYMSGYTENAIAHHGVLDAGTNFIQKPFRPQELAKKVRQVLDS